MEISGIGLAFAGAAIVAAGGGIGSSIGMGYAGATGAGAAAEKPEIFGKILLLQALPGSQGIYGFVGAFLILFFSGILGGTAGSLSVATGWQYLFSAFPLAFAALFSGMYQGRVSAAGINLVSKDDTQVAKAMILSAMVETWAIIGFLVTFLLLISIKN